MQHERIIIITSQESNVTWLSQNSPGMKSTFLKP